MTGLSGISPVETPRAEGIERQRLGFLTSHPIQYQAPLFRALAQQCDVHVYFAHRQDAQGQASEGYGVAFDWDVDLLSGYESTFLRNTAKNPSVTRFFGCRSSELDDEVSTGKYTGFVVFGWNLWVYWQAIRACRRHGVPVFVRGDSHLGTPRSWIVRAIKHLIYPRLFRMIDGFFAVGGKSRDYLLHYGVSNEKIHLAQHVVDVDHFSTPSSRAVQEVEVLIAASRAHSSQKIVLFVGRLIASKRVDEIVRAIGAIPKAHRPLLLVAGNGPDRDRLQNIATENNVVAVFAGFVNQHALPAYFAAADLLVLPSHETWGLVVNESIAAGTPVLVADVAGCAEELVASNQTGETFPLGDLQAMSQKIMKILPEGKDRFRSALKLKSEWFSPATSAKKILEVFSSMGCKTK